MGLDWLTLVAMTWMVGSIGVSAFALQGAPAKPLRDATRTARRAHVIFANLLMCVSSVLVMLYPTRHFSDGRTVLIGILRLVLVGMIALLLLRGSRYIPVVFLAGIGLLLTQSMLSRSAAQRDWLAPTVADWLHLLLSSIWMGGLGLLAFVCIPATVRDPKLRAPLSSMLQKFSPLALLCGMGLALSGIAQASSRVDGVSALLGTSYGQILLLKIGLFLAMTGFGTFHQLVVIPRVRPALLASDKIANNAAFAITVLIELLLGLLVLFVATLMRAQ